MTVRQGRRVLTAAAVVLLVVFALVVDWLADGLTARLMYGSHSTVLTSVPSGARVEIDGADRGVTPLTIRWAKPRTIEVLLQHPHHHDTGRTVELGAAPAAEISVEFTAASGELYVLSNPRGAQITLDGETVAGTAPLRLTGIATGQHELRATYEDRPIESALVEVFPDRETTHRFELNGAAEGRLTLDTSPPDAQIELVGTDVTYDPETPLPVGRYLVRVSADGFHTLERYFDVTALGTYRSVSLERAYGLLQVDAQPDDALVRVLYELGGELHERNYYERLRVPVGTVRIKTSALGYRVDTRDLPLGTNGLQVDIKLERLNVVAGTTLRDDLRDGGQGPLLRIIPAGRFVMGSDTGPRNARPAREVLVAAPFAMSVHEVSNAEFARYRNDWDGVPDEPVTDVEFADTQGYAAWLSEQSGHQYRLPSEAEWEYAAAGHRRSSYFFGDDPTLVCRYGNIADASFAASFLKHGTAECDDGYVQLAPVGQFEPNPFGLYDTIGNVEELTADCWHFSFENAPAVAEPWGRICQSRAVRGGSYDSTPDEATGTSRDVGNSAASGRGFRLLREL